MQVAHKCPECGAPTTLDDDSGEEVCTNCGLVIESVQLVEHEVFGRSPTNESVFGRNLASTTRRTRDARQINAVASIHGSSNGDKPPLTTFTDTCKECGTEIRIHLYGSEVHCSKCGTYIGEYVFRRVPKESYKRFMMDLWSLKAWDQPVDTLEKAALEVFSEAVQTMGLSEEQVSALAAVFKKSFKDWLKKLNAKKEMRAILDIILKKRRLAAEASDRKDTR